MPSIVLPSFTHRRHPDTVDAFGFIGESLSLLDDLQQTQGSHIREQFEQQCAFIAGKFEQAQYERGQRDCIVGQDSQRQRKIVRD